MMIIDNITNVTKYAAILPQLEKVPDILAQIDLKNPDKVEYEDGFYFVQKGVTRPIEDTIFETHENYIDVQILLKGNEFMGWDIRPHLKVTQAYDPENDITIYSGKNSSHAMNVHANTFYIFFPWDAHRAAFHIEKESEYVKLIIKLKVTENIL